MKYTGTFNKHLLHEELEAAGYVGVSTEGKYAKYTMSIGDGWVDIELRESTDYAALDEIIAHHDHTKKSKAENAKEEKEAKKAQALAKLGISEEDLKDLLS